MKKLIKLFPVLLLVFILAVNCGSNAQTSVQLAMAVDTNIFFYENVAAENDYEIIIDEYISFDSKGENFFADNVDRLMSTLPVRVLKRHGEDFKYSKVFKFYDGFKQMTDIPFGKKFYISSASGVMKAEIYGYYVSNSNGFLGPEFYPMLKPEKSLNLSPEDGFVQRLYIVSDNPKLTALNLDEFQNGKIISLAKNAVKPYRDKVGNPNPEMETEELIKVYSGNFTSKSEEQYLVSCRYRTEFTQWSSGVFVMNGKGEIISDVFTFAENSFEFVLAQGTVDTDGDGLMEVLIEIGYHEGTGFVLYKYNGIDFNPVADGFFVGV